MLRVSRQSPGQQTWEPPELDSGGSGQPKSEGRQGRYGQDFRGSFLLRTFSAAIFANPRSMPELLITAPGQSFSAAFRNRAKSSVLIFTFT